MNNFITDLQQDFQNKNLNNPNKTFNNFESSKEVIVHIKDIRENTSKDFRVDKQLLINKMKYFDKFTKNREKNRGDKLRALDELDITVKCSPKIFEWILKFLGENKGSRPKFHPGEVLQILISADSLIIPSLIEEC